MPIRSTKSSLLSLTAVAALLAAPAFAQGQDQAQPRDGAPGNPPSTATQRAADAVTGNQTPPDGTPGNPPGTAAGRAAERAGNAVSGATDNAGRSADAAHPSLRPDGSQGNPPGTVVTRGVDRALGTNLSGAFPENEQGRNERTDQGSAGGQPATVTGRDAPAQGGSRVNEPPAANANPRAMGSTQGQTAQSGGQGGMPGAVNATPDGNQARSGTMAVPLQNQAAGNAQGTQNGNPDRAANNAATAGNQNGDRGTTANAPAAQTDRASRIIGSTVYNERNESIGSVDDLIMPQGNSSPMVVVSVGGFLGIGAKLVAVPLSDLRWSAADNRWTIAGATKESLTSLPAYSYDAARRG
ncbi:PRC-barrel domain-containing protein [Roseomonas xinghualingensis]|uniref:PRC-barrel domain-containing protein n=1 Tax=Roseomonas xinghualingensis TaxID=2986475 RepID=UPI0021F1DF71|nr:PRC-barrel domain-containing protein [Roseomonas sp. SXEYE001]MCV4206477.1 PRC-barrel domain-containing protein [Roseomonas sp. SXEYE001]